MIRRSVGELATSLGLEVVGDASVVIHGVADLTHAGPEQLSFVRDLKYRELAVRSRAGAMLVAQALPLPVPQLVSRNVGADFARIAAIFHPVPNATTHRIDPRAAIDPSAVLGEPVEIGPFAVVGARSRIGSGTTLRARVTVGADCVVGNDCCLQPGVVLYDRVRLGDRVLVHANAVLGSDGFGYAQDGPTYVKVPQVGGLVIGDEVEIGAGTMIDRGAMGDTRIGRGTKIDNLVHVGHNCVIGEDVAIAGLCALAGSTVVGDRVQLAGHVVTAGHMRIGDDVRIGGNSAVADDVLEPGDHMGYPVMPKSRWLRTLGWIARATKPRPGREQQPPAGQDA